MSERNRTGHSDVEERTKALFDESVSALDGETRSRLTRARHRALEETNTTRAAWRPQWVPAGAVAAGVLALLILWQGQPIDSNQQQTLDLAALSDLEMLLGDEELEMIEELEFYAWLDELAETSPELGDGVG